MQIGFLDRLAQAGAMVCDGAMGTNLESRGAPLGLCPEELNLTHPHFVRSILADYVEAGADIITAASFGANRYKLGKAGMGDRVADFNQAAARIAREVAGQHAFVAGDIGPLGEFVEPVGEVQYSQAVEAFSEQARVLAEGGVDLFIVETMYDVTEVRAAVEGIRRVSALPIAASLTFDQMGRTMMGVTPAEAAAALREMHVDVMGTNCGSGPEETEIAVAAMRQVWPEGPMIAQPNAGLPKVHGDTVTYSIGPDEMAAFALRYFEKYGVKIVGSCCGSTPEFTRAILRKVRESGL